MKIVYAKTSAMIDGFHVRQGSYWPANDPLVTANPSLFSEDPREGLLSSTRPVWELNPEDSPVEQVTAGPGEKRGQVRRG